MAAGLFAKALGRLDSTPLEAVSDTLAFESVDPLVLAKRLDIQRHGTEQGKQNLPRPDDQTLDSFQHTILSEIEEYRRRAMDRVTRSLEAFSARLRAFDFEQALLDVIAAISEAKANFLAEVHQGENELFQKRRGVIGATNDVDRFKKTHRIERQAHPPESRFLIWGVVISLLLIETLLNSSLFAGGLAGGFIEGMSVALGVAFGNVAIGFGVGLYVVRFLLYRNYLIRLLALIGLLADLALAAFLNLGAARFRTALNTNDPESALSAAFGVPPIEVFQNLTAIAGFQSYVLIVVGILFHVGALIDGFKFDDPYPFYGKYWKKREDAETDYRETKERLISILTRQRDDTVSEMRDASSRLSASRRIAARIAQNGSMARQRFITYLDNLERVANQLLSLYREANSAQRSTARPGYFATSWSFPNRGLAIGDDGEAFAVDDDIAKRTQEELEAGIREVNDTYIEAVTRYRRIETMLEEDLARAQRANEAA